MSKQIIKFIAFALLTIFMVNTIVWSLSSHRLAHEIEHAREQQQIVLSSDSGDNQTSDVIDAQDSSAHSVSEHQLLHAVDHLQLFPSTAVYGTSRALPSIIRSQFISCILPLAAFDLPYRPPRNISLLA
jgi:hypothetical protein